MMKQKLITCIKTALNQLSEQKGWKNIEIDNVPIDYSKGGSFGHYASSVSFIVSKQFGIPPIEAANLLKPYLVHDEIDKVEAVGPYLNFFIKKENLSNQLKEIGQLKEQYGSNVGGSDRKILIEYSSPNIAKTFGIGHLRSTIIGQAIYNLYKFDGWQCIGDNHLGDWGTQFGKLIFQIKSKKADLKSLTVELLEKLYIEFHQELADHPEYEENARMEFAKLDSGDQENKKIWEICRDISLSEFERIYNLLDIKIDYALGESFFANDAQLITQEIIEKGLGRESEGAYIVEFEDKTVQVIKKSDGSSTYLTRDLAAIKYRLNKWQPEMIVYEVGIDQQLYFSQLFELAKRLGWADKTKLVYVGHGLIRSEDGKFSTRQGQTIHLQDVLQESISLATKMMSESVKDKVTDENQRKELAKIIGIGAIKYNDLSVHHSQDVIFDWSKVLNLKGNSGPYVQYTFARCMSLLEKGNYKPSESIDDYQMSDKEGDIVFSLSKFPEICRKAQDEFSPNLLCNYIFELCQEFNAYYDQTPIATVDDESARTFRLSLVFAIGQVIKNALNLLGIVAPVKI